MKKNILFIIQVVFFAIQVSHASVIPVKQNFNDHWKFIRVNDDLKADYSSSDIIDKNWENVSLPHTANLEPLIVNNQWQGLCWYRKHLNIKDYNKEDNYFIEFEAAMNVVEIWINGKFVKKDQGGYLPVVINATKYLNDKDNVISLRLDNRDNPTTGPKPLKMLDFNMYGGLYRNAWLIKKNGIYISNPSYENITAGGGIFVTFPFVSDNKSVIDIKTNVINSKNSDKAINVVHEIYDANKKLVKRYKSDDFTISALKSYDNVSSISLENAKLWSPSSPNLYKVVTKIYSGHDLLDTETTTIGIREFKFINNQLYINGKKTFLNGVNRHQEYPFVGYALSDNAQYRDAMKIKDAGFDYIRLSHYPQSPAFMNACDELGIVVIDAILGWQYYKENSDFKNFCYDYAHRLIRRDRNHPCVLAWEVSLNETQMPVEFMQRLHDIVHSEYPGKNVYSCGWMNDVYDIYLQARQHRILHKDQVSFDKPYMVSEYGDWEYYSTNSGFNQHNHSKEKRLESSSRQERGDGEIRLLQQAKNLQESHNDNHSIPAFGDGYWVMYDYNRGYDSHLETSGVMDIFRLPKFSYYFYRSQRDMINDKDCVLKIASYWDDKSSNDVTVYSNADEVELYLNNNLISRQSPDNNSISSNLKHPPFTFHMNGFTKGTLMAKAYKNGKLVKTEFVSTPKKVTSLRCRLDVSGKNAQSDCNDLIFLYIEAIDNNGIICHDYSEEVKMQLPSGITLMNVGSVKAKAGIATALIRIDGKKGKYKIGVSDKLNDKGELIIKVK